AGLLDPKSADALEALGRVHLHRNEIDQALSAFLSAVEIKPKNATLLSNTGYVFLKRGDLMQARTYLERAIASDNSLVEAHNNLGIVLARMGEPDHALSEFLAVNEPAAAFNNLGVVYMDQKRWTEARDVFKRAVLLDPTYKKAQANMVEAEAHVPRPTVINLPAFKDSSVALAAKNPAPGKTAVTRTEAKASVTRRESRISTAYRD